MINAINALKLTKEHDDWNLREILYATINGKTMCKVYWGTELTEEELKAKRREWKNLGYRIIREDVYTSWGGDNREPEYNCPPEYRAVISWSND